MKEQTRNTEVQINEEEIGKLSEKEFRIMIVKMIKNLENRMKKMQESINKDLEELNVFLESLLSGFFPLLGVTLFIPVINLYLYIGLLQFCRVFFFIPSFFNFNF